MEKLLIIYDAANRGITITSAGGGWHVVLGCGYELNTDLLAAGTDLYINVPDFCCNKCEEEDCIVEVMNLDEEDKDGNGDE